MDQQRIYEAARDVLKEIEALPVSRLTIGEALFVFRHCLYTPEHGLQVTSNFGERELRELLTITGAIMKRAGPGALH